MSEKQNEGKRLGRGGGGTLGAAVLLPLWYQPAGGKTPRLGAVLTPQRTQAGCSAPGGASSHLSSQPTAEPHAAPHRHNGHEFVSTTVSVYFILLLSTAEQPHRTETGSTEE